jgi:hypothetical protein
MLAETLATLAIVTQDRVSLRAAASDSAPQQAVLWQGETLEIRGQRRGYLQVFDHRRERAGYVKAAQVRRVPLTSAEAPELLSVVRFLRETPGAEALGISYAAAYVKAAPAEALTVEPFDALGSMADRLAHRASTNQAKASEAALAAHLEVVAEQGLRMVSLDRGGSVQICYDGEMFRRVLAMPAADAEQRARAALGLTRHECVSQNLGPTDRYQLERWQAEVLDRVPATGLSEILGNRVRMRRAGVWSALAFDQVRRGESPQAAAERALQELADVVTTELSDDDQIEYADAAIRVGASRWAAEPAIATAGKLTVSTAPGAPGETCVLLHDAKHDAGNPLMRRCTYGTVWTASARSDTTGTALTLAVQPLATWRELWLFRATPHGWALTIVPPGTSDPELGYIEFAGWIPGARHMLAVREVNADGRFVRRFEIRRRDTLTVEKQASSPALLAAFGRWQDADWKRTTIALR